MSKPKQTPVSLPGSQVKSKPQPSPAKAPLSQEFIDSSDDSAPEAPPAKSSTKADSKSKKDKREKKEKTEKKEKKEKKEKRAKKEQVNIAVHRPKTNGTVKQTPVPLPGAKQTQPLVNQKKDAETSDSDGSDEETNTAAASKNANGVGVVAKPAAEDPDESESTSSDESSEEHETAAPTRNKTNSTSTRPSQVHTVEFTPALPYVPPKNFEALPTPLRTNPSMKLFDNVQGKEVWHITAPAGVPLSKIKELAMERVLDGEVVMDHRGTDYGFSAAEKGDEGARQVLIPGQEGFKSVSSRIHRTLHLQQKLKLPKLNAKQADTYTGSQAAASITRSTIRAPRPQVKGLKMRYFHSGFGDEEPGTLGVSDSETEAPAPAGLGIMKGTQVQDKEKKRKHDEVNGTEAPLSSKKHKKERSEEELKMRQERRAKKEKKRREQAAS